MLRKPPTCPNCGGALQLISPGLSRDRGCPTCGNVYDGDGTLIGESSGQPAPGPEREVELLCPACTEPSLVGAARQDWTCSSCGHRHFVEVCKNCFRILQRASTSRRISCPWCGEPHSSWSPAPSTAGDLSEQLEELGLSSEHHHPDNRYLLGCAVVGGFGHDILAGARVNLLCREREIAIVTGGDEVAAAAYEDVNLLEVGGRGEMRSGGGFIGGGFGLSGAAEGMLVASVLNSLTSKTKVETLISLRTDHWQLILLYNKATPDAVRIELAPALARVDKALRSSKGAASSAGSTADELAKLAELHAAGVLTDTEFSAAKARLLEIDPR